LNVARTYGAGRGATARGNRLRNTLVVTELALTVVLLAAAGLLLRSYVAVLGADPGFSPRNMPVAETVLPSLIVRTATDPLALAGTVRDAIWRVDADQPVSSLRTMDDIFEAELANRDTQLALVGAFAGLALLLAAVGLYGVLSYAVARRTSEIGLRMALGARRGTVVRAVVGSALLLACVGLVAGVGTALALARLLESFLFEVSSTDPLTYVAAAALLLLVAAAAAYVPALRAANVDPMVALRDEQRLKSVSAISRVGRRRLRRPTIRSISLRDRRCGVSMRQRTHRQYFTRKPTVNRRPRTS
jgi:hypothetical protein